MANRFGAVYAIAKSPELHMTDEELHTLVYDLTRKDSLKQLNNDELKQLVSKLYLMKDQVRGTKRNFSKRGNKCTVYQRKKVYMLMVDLGWNEYRITGLIKKMFNVETIEWLDYMQCSKLIEALKAMLSRQGELHMRNKDGGNR